MSTRKIVIEFDYPLHGFSADFSGAMDVTQQDLLNVLLENYVTIARETIANHSKGEDGCKDPDCHLVDYHTEIIAAIESTRSLYKITH